MCSLCCTRSHVCATKRHTAAADDDTRLITQSGHHLVEHDVLLHLDKRNDERLMRVKALAAGLALTPGRALVGFAGEPNSDNCRRHPISETFGNPAGRATRIRRIQIPLSKIATVSMAIKVTSIGDHEPQITKNDIINLDRISIDALQDTTSVDTLGCVT